jgi:hypothetical protein
MGLGCPSSSSMEWTNPAAVRAAGSAIGLLGIHRDTGMGSRFQPVRFLAARGLDPAVTANHETVALLFSRARVSWSRAGTICNMVLVLVWAGRRAGFDGLCGRVDGGRQTTGALP